MNVEFSDCDRNARGKSELRRPLGAKRSGGLSRVIGFVIEPVAQFGEARIERRQELLVRKAAPIVGVKRLVAGGANAALDQSRIGDPGQHRRHPVGEFNPGKSGVERLRSDVQAMPELGPKPLRGVDPSTFGDVLRPKLGAELRDFGCLAPAGVILPQPALRGRDCPSTSRSTPAAGSCRQPESGLIRSSRRRCRRPSKRRNRACARLRRARALMLSSRPNR